MAILIADKRLDTETSCWYSFVCDKAEDIASLPTSRSSGLSDQVKKVARQTSIAYCIEEARQYMLDSNDEWRAMAALSDDVLEALNVSAKELLHLREDIEGIKTTAEEAATDAKEAATQVKQNADKIEERTSMLEAVEGIASVYTNQVDFSAAIKLRSIVIGSDADSYSNVNLTSTIKLDFSALAVLEELRIDHCPNLTAPVDVSGCVALKVASFKGTPVSAVNFAAGSALEECYLERPVSLILREMKNIKTFEVTDGYANLTGLRHENTPFPAAYDIVTAAAKLYTVRLAGIDWQLAGTDLLNRLLEMTGFDENGLEIPQSSLSGKVYTSVIRQAEVQNYAAAWPDLAVTYGGTVQQYTVTFQNDDGTPLYLKNGKKAEFLVDRGSSCPDPVATGQMDTPTKDPTQAEVFTYDSWDASLAQVLSDMVVKASYTSVPQKYTVRWLAQIGVVVGSETVDYDTEATPPDDPERTDEESSSIYNLFNGWNKSTVHVRENMDVYANWIRGALPKVGDPLDGINLAQLYGIKKSGKAAQYLTDDNIKARVAFTMGYEPEYENVRSELLAENMLLDGTTSKDTGIKLLETDTSWTLLVDCAFDKPTSDSCMVSCFTQTGYHGFQVKYSSGTAVTWGTNTINNGLTTAISTISGVGTQYVSDQYRELVILRHTKGNRNLKVYISNPTGDNITVREMTKITDTKSTVTLMLGCDNTSKNFATGTLFRCRLWYDDLGEDECMKMAVWPREECELELISSGGATTETEALSTLDLIHAGLLSGLHRANPSGYNSGGWPSSEIRTWLQKRYLAGLPTPLSNMLEPVQIMSVDRGDGVATALQSTDRVHLPSVREMCGCSNDPYSYCGNQIPWFTSNNSRVKFAGYTTADGIRFTTADIAPKSPKKGDVWQCSANDSICYIWDGNAWVAAKWYWMRDAQDELDANFCVVKDNGVSQYSNGKPYSGWAGTPYGVLPMLHL